MFAIQVLSSRAAILSRGFFLLLLSACATAPDAPVEHRDCHMVCDGKVESCTITRVSTPYAMREFKTETERDAAYDALGGLVRPHAYRFTLRFDGQPHYVLIYPSMMSVAMPGIICPP